MHHQFWHERWQSGRTDFNKAEPNAWLVAQLRALQLAPGCHVFLPLCGKTHDLHFLAGQGARVSGIELSPIAVEAFFAEHGLEPRKSRDGGLDVYEAGGIRIFCGDFFALAPAQLGRVDAVFDRAALVALPPGMRPDYAQHLATLVTPGARDLLVSFDYPQAEMDGPPFCVAQPEIRSLFGAHFDIAPLGRKDILEHEPKFRDRGVTRMSETCWLMLRR